MTPLMLMALMIGLPVLLLLVLRVNAAIVFLSLCLGSVLVQFASKDAMSFLILFSSSVKANATAISLILLFIPVVLTILVMIGTVRGKVRVVLNLFPALAAGVVGLLLAEPFFAPGLRGAVGQSPLWHQLLRAESLVVGASTLISILFLWLQRPKKEKEKGGH